jgi:hypothetical protein
VTAAALVLLRRAVAVLVAADRNVFCTVVVRELAAAQREHRRCEGEERDEELLRSRPQSLVLAHAFHGDARAGDRREDPAVLHRQLCCGQCALHLRQERNRLEQPRRAPEERVAHLGRDQPLAPRGNLDLAVRVADRARPRRRPVHEHAVRERHSTEAKLVAHALPAYRRSAF